MNGLDHGVRCRCEKAVDVPPELVDKTYMARANCPEEAITIETDGSLS
jgi:ferredoxin